VTRSRRPSAQTIAVLLALAETSAAWRYGYELGQQVGLKAGSMYPILMRLADRGLLETSWETDPPPGRPARHLYRLTGPGLDLATTLAEPDPAPAPAPAPKQAPARKQAAARKGAPARLRPKRA
jgi:PadR family transcriptional regulator, regulatory protein PadR